MQVLRHRAAIGGEQGDQEHEVLPRRRVDRGRRFRQPSGKCQVTHVTRVICYETYLQISPKLWYEWFPHRFLISISRPGQQRKIQTKTFHAFFCATVSAAS